MHRLLRRAIVPATLLVVTACFATRGDVRLLQADIALAKSDAARADSLHRAQLLALSRQVGAVAVNEGENIIAVVRRQPRYRIGS